jgi:hypothetical protein
MGNTSPAQGGGTGGGSKAHCQRVGLRRTTAEVPVAGRVGASIGGEKWTRMRQEAAAAGAAVWDHSGGSGAGAFPSAAAACRLPSARTRIVGLLGPLPQLARGDDVRRVEPEVGEAAREDDAVDRPEDAVKLLLAAVVPAVLVPTEMGSRHRDQSGQWALEGAAA